MGPMGSITLHVYKFKGLIDPLPDLGAWNAKILRSKCHILLYNGCHNLVVRVLEHHSCALSNLPKIIWISGIQPLYKYPSFGGKKYGIDMLRKGGFPRA